MLIEKQNCGAKISMEATTKGVLSENMTIREASKLFNVLFETCVNGSVIPGSSQVQPQF